MASSFVKNHAWPILGGLVAALITALQTGASELLADGLQQDDWPRIGGLLVSAALGYGLVVFNRYGGRSEPWVQPQK